MEEGGFSRDQAKPGGNKRKEFGGVGRQKGKEGGSMEKSWGSSKLCKENQGIESEGWRGGVVKLT